MRRIWADRYRQQPLYIKISLMHCMIICGVVALLALVIGRFASGILIRQKTDNCGKDLFAISEKMDMLFSGYERDSSAIIKNQQYQDVLNLGEEASKNESALRSLKIALALADFHSSYTKIRRIRFYDAIRRVTIDNERVSSDRGSPPSWAGVDAFISARDTSCWTSFCVTAGLDAYVSLLHRVNNYSGKFIGVLELTVDETQIERMYRDFESEDMRFFLLDEAGCIVSATQKGRLGDALMDERAFADVTRGDYVSGDCRIDGADCLVIGKRYDKFGSWIIGVANRRAIVEDVRPLLLITVLIGAAGILLASVLVRWTSKKSTYPLERVLSVVDNVSRGNFDARVDLRDSGEYRGLSLQLNEMIDNMVAMMDLIRRQSEQKRLYELQNLQMQMNPHFLYNSLETVCGIIDAGDDRLAIRMVNEISRFYRGVLSGGSSLVTVEQELQITRRYLEIVKIRYRDSFEYDVKIHSCMLPVLIPKLLLQPLVENSVVHGFIGKRAHARLWIHGCVRDGKSVICISDNGCGMPPDTLRRVLSGESPEAYRGNGFGLSSIDQRMKLTYGEAYGLQIWSRTGIGTRVTVTLPLTGKETPL